LLIAWNLESVVSEVRCSAVQCSIAHGWRAIMYSRDLECLVDRLQK
jgi:hypothetical protein